MLYQSPITFIQPKEKKKKKKKLLGLFYSLALFFHNSMGKKSPINAMSETLT